MQSCRICGEEEDSDEPLREPCQCDGSMRYVHETCLLKWLQVKGKSQCEVCKTQFQFKAVYKPDAPQQLSLKDLGLWMCECAQKLIIKKAVSMYLWTVLFVNLSAWLCLCILQFVDTGHFQLGVQPHFSGVHVLLLPNFVFSGLGLVVCSQGLLFVHLWLSRLVGDTGEGEGDAREEDDADVGIAIRILAGLYVNIVSSLLGVVLPMFIGRGVSNLLGYKEIALFQSASHDVHMWLLGLAPMLLYLAYPYIRVAALNGAPLVFMTATFWQLFVGPKAHESPLADHRSLYITVTGVFVILIVVIPARVVWFFFLDGRANLTRTGSLLQGGIAYVENIQDCMVLTTVGIGCIVFALYPAIRGLHLLHVLPFVTVSETSRNSMQILFLHVLFPLLLRGPIMPPVITHGQAVQDWLDRTFSTGWTGSIVRMTAVVLSLLMGYFACISIPVTVGRVFVTTEDDALAYVAGVGLLYALGHARKIVALVRHRLVDCLSMGMVLTYMLGVVPVILGHGFFALTSLRHGGMQSLHAVWLAGLLVGKSAVIFAFVWLSAEEEQVLYALIDRPLDRQLHARIVQSTLCLIKSYCLHVLLPTVVEYMLNMEDAIVKIFTPVSVFGSVIYMHVFPAVRAVWRRARNHIFDRRYLVKTQLVNFHAPT